MLLCEPDTAVNIPGKNRVDSPVNLEDVDLRASSAHPSRYEQGKPDY